MDWRWLTASGLGKFREHRSSGRTGTARRKSPELVEAVDYLPARNSGITCGACELMTRDCVAFVNYRGWQQLPCCTGGHLTEP